MLTNEQIFAKAVMAVAYNEPADFPVEVFLNFRLCVAIADLTNEEFWEEAISESEYEYETAVLMTMHACCAEDPDTFAKRNKEAKEVFNSRNSLGGDFIALINKAWEQGGYNNVKAILKRAGNQERAELHEQAKALGY